jgi:uncharacterized protein YdeI (YjbR/CyaY-like superfamily)
LESHHDTEREIWLIFYKKHTGKSGIPYDAAVEEAICFGWIDSLMKRMDDERYIQKFSPRRKASRWSSLNIERAERMTEAGLMAPSGLARYEEVKRNPQKIVVRETGEPSLPSDLQRALKRSGPAVSHFVGFSKSYRRLCIGWINDAKRDGTRKRRIREVVDLAAQGKRIGIK